jgi:hypothetical protein
VNALDLDRVLREAEKLLRTHLPSQAARESRKGLAPQRLTAMLGSPVREAFRRLRRSTLIFLFIIAALIAYRLLVAPLGFSTWFLAILAAYGVSFVALLLPTRRRTVRASEPRQGRNDITANGEELRLARRGQLPAAALPAADAILSKLEILQPHLQRLELGSRLENDAHRLIGKHLPQLVNAFLALPPNSRAPGSENCRRFTESLETVANELDGLIHEVSRDRREHFETQWRFIEARYKGTDGLEGR